MIVYLQLIMQSLPFAIENHVIGSSWIMNFAVFCEYQLSCHDALCRFLWWLNPSLPLNFWLTNCHRLPKRLSRRATKKVQGILGKMTTNALQGWAKLLLPGLENIVPAVPYRFSLNLPITFSQPGIGNLARPGKFIFANFQKYLCRWS